VAFFVEMAPCSGGPVLELGCGTGCVLIPTARVGIEIAGLHRNDFIMAAKTDQLYAAFT
jgi:2-polyprenyl-3-methyl-5-hydroxy-6-metoxy-1,4-benzoquinol methylase